MKVSEAIERSALIYPSDEERAPLYAWLSELEGKIALELLGAEPSPITESDGERELYAPSAYSEIYPLYLMMKRELSCGDSERYAFFLSVFTAAYGDFAAYVSRTRDKGKVTYIKTV